MNNIANFFCQGTDKMPPEEVISENQTNLRQSSPLKSMSTSTNSSPVKVSYLEFTVITMGIKFMTKIMIKSSLKGVFVVNYSIVHQGLMDRFKQYFIVDNTRDIY